MTVIQKRQQFVDLYQAYLVDNLFELVTPEQMRDLMAYINVNKADLINGKVPVEQLPEIGGASDWGDLGGNIENQADLVSYINQKVAELVGSSPEALNTLNEFAIALNNDPNFATTMVNHLAGKQSTDQKGQPNGYAGLDAQGKVPSSQLPAVSQTQTDQFPPYDPLEPYLAGEQVLHNTKFWEAKINVPAGNAPAENMYWKELSTTHLQNTDTALKRSNGTTIQADNIEEKGHKQSADSITTGSRTTVTPVTTSGQSRAIDLSDRQHTAARITINQGCTFSFLNATDGDFLTMLVIKDTLNNCELMFGANSYGEGDMLLNGGTSPLILTGVQGSRHLLGIHFVSDGTTLLTLVTAGRNFT